MNLKLALVYGSVRSARRGIRAVRFLERSFVGRGHQVTTVDAAEYRLPLLDRMYKEYAKGEAPADLQSLAYVFLQADAVVIVSGEYNHAPPPALLNLLDHFLEEYRWRPSAIVCYSAGSFGGVRAAEQLRSSLCEMGMSSIPTAFPIPRIEEALAEDGTPSDAATVQRRFDRFASELEWYAEALRSRRQQGVPY